VSAYSPAGEEYTEHNLVNLTIPTTNIYLNRILVWLRWADLDDDRKDDPYLELQETLSSPTGMTTCKRFFHPLMCSGHVFHDSSSWKLGSVQKIGSLCYRLSTLTIKAFVVFIGNLGWLDDHACTWLLMCLSLLLCRWFVGCLRSCLLVS
jgi:hypothetical protein